VTEVTAVSAVSVILWMIVAKSSMATASCSHFWIKDSVSPAVASLEGVVCKAGCDSPCVVSVVMNTTVAVLVFPSVHGAPTSSCWNTQQ